MADPEDRPADDERDDIGDGEADAGTADDAASPARDEDGSEDDRVEPSDDDADTDEDVPDDDADDDRSDDHESADADSDDSDSDSADDSESDSDSADDSESDSDSADDSESDSDSADAEAEEAGTGQEPASALPPPVEPAPFVELMAAYRQPATAGAERLPWSWTTLSGAEKEAGAAVLDGFVESYNRTWAISDDQAVPPCWHRHAALAHDLATLAWSYFHAYRDATATPDRALSFQAHLPLFAERVDRWLGAAAGDCRAGQHADAWPDPDRAAGSRGTTTEDADAVLLLGRETFGFTPPADR